MFNPKVLVGATYRLLYKIEMRFQYYIKLIQLTIAMKLIKIQAQTSES